LTRFILVPGAWLGSWVWKRVVLLLESRGHHAYPITLTGMGDRVHLATKEVGIDTAVLDVVNTIEFEDLTDVVLVGHSFAGKVVAAVADRAPENVRMILYVDAFRPRTVRTPQGDFGDEWKHLKDWKVPLTEEILDAIGGDVNNSDREWLMSKATAWPRRHATDSIILSEKFDNVRKAYILCTGGGDDVQRIINEKLDGPFRVIESGHWPMVTKPEELVEDMLSLVAH